MIAIEGGASAQTAASTAEKYINAVIYGINGYLTVYSRIHDWAVHRGISWSYPA